MTTIAIFGASSLIAGDYISNLASFTNHKCFLFGRTMNSLLNIKNPKNFPRLLYEDFNTEENYDLIINFIGSGNPKKTLAIGKEIIEVTEYYDQLIIDYLKTHQETKYIFISSGIAYGGDFSKPVYDSTIGEKKTVAFGQNWYAISKFSTEIKHTFYKNLNIIDLRIFSYISENIDLESRFLITDIIRSIQKKETFITSTVNIYRDYMSSWDFFRLIEKITFSKKLKIRTIDCRTKAPLGKIEMLEMLSNKYNLKYEFSNKEKGLNVTGYKKHYYSLKSFPESLNYRPTLSSMENIFLTLNSILGKSKT